MPVYPDNVLSVHEKFADLPAVLGTIDLNRRIVAGNPLDHQHLKHAQDTATALRGLINVGQFPHLNEEVVQSADLRAKAIESLHATLEYAPVNVAQMLANLNENLTDLRNEMRNGIDQMRNGIDLVRTETFNGFARMKNQNRLISPDDLTLVKKMVEGSGLNLAQAVAHHHTVNPQTRAALTNYATQSMNPAPAIGTAPVWFDGNIHAAQHVDILKLICFYNEDLGIINEDDLKERKRKLVKYLSSL